MEITGNSAFYAGLGAIKSGQQRFDQAAEQVANLSAERAATSQSSDYQAERLRSVDRSQQMDFATATVEQTLAVQQVELGAKVAKASDEMLGRIIDTWA